MENLTHATSIFFIILIANWLVTAAMPLVLGRGRLSQEANAGWDKLRINQYKHLRIFRLDLSRAS